MRQVKNGATIGYMRLALANKRTAIILSTGMYLKLTKNGEKHNEPAVQREASARLHDYVSLVSDISSFDEADFDEYTSINECAYRLKKITDDAVKTNGTRRSAGNATALIISSMENASIPWHGQSSKATRKFQKSTTWSASAMSGNRGGRRRQNAASPSASKPQ